MAAPQKGRTLAPPSSVPITPHSGTVPTGVPAGVQGHSTTPTAERPEGVARGAPQSSPLTMTDVLTPSRNEQDVDRAVAEGVVQAEIAAQEAVRDNQIAMQAYSVGMEEGKWRQFVESNSPEIVSELITMLGQRENEKLRAGILHDEDPRPVMSGKDRVESGRVNEGDMRALAAQLLPEKWRLKYTLLADPILEGDTKRRTISRVLKVNANRLVLEQGYSTNLLEVEFRINDIPCGFEKRNGLPCDYRSDSAVKAIDHRRYHHPQQWSAWREKQTEEENAIRRSEAERQTKLMELIAERLGSGGDNPAMAQALNRLADILGNQPQLAATAASAE